MKMQHFLRKQEEYENLIRARKWLRELFNKIDAIRNDSDEEMKFVLNNTPEIYELFRDFENKISEVSSDLKGKIQDFEI